MRHGYFGRKLSRTKNERRHLLAGLVRDLILHDSITTSLAKAKAAQPVIEKLITKSRIGTDAAQRQMATVVPDKKIVRMLLADAKTRFSMRTSGFTRITKVDRRLGDSTQMAMLSFVDEKVIQEVVKPKTEEKKEAASEKATRKTKSVKDSK